ncbi:MAG: AAA family ATPase [Bacteroidota bacterium]
MKIHLVGASGSGVTTLGQALAKELAYPYFDVDNYYWKKTDPPFTEKQPVAHRQTSLRTDLSPHPNWILGGSLISWSDFIQDTFDLTVFLNLPPDVRIARLRRREQQRYGTVIETDPVRRRQYEDFMEWAAQYERDDFSGRSRKNHLDWLETLKCPVLKLEGDLSVADRVRRVKDELVRI